MTIDDIYCLSFLDGSCNKKIVGEVKIKEIVIGSTDANSWITVEPVCETTLLDNLQSADEISLCRGTCGAPSGGLFVSTVEPTCGVNGDNWIKIDSFGNTTNFYRRINGVWVEQDLNDPCPNVGVRAASSGDVFGY